MVAAGESCVHRNHGGVQRVGFSSGIGCQLDAQRLSLTVRAISGRADLIVPEESVLLHLRQGPTEAFRLMLQLIDQLLLAVAAGRPGDPSDCGL